MFNDDFFAQNRQRLSDLLPDSLIIVPAYNLMQKNIDSAHSFKQESNFWWLSGIDYPDWMLMIDSKISKTYLVSPELSEVNKIFNGNLSLDQAKSTSGADEVIAKDKFIELIKEKSLIFNQVYTLAPQSDSDKFEFVLNPAYKNTNILLGKTFKKVLDLTGQLIKLRAIKQPQEILAIKKAIDLTIDGFKLIRRNLCDYRYEYQVEAELGYYFRKNGATGHAYDPIIASGKNACTLHYVRNNAAVRSNQLLLIDAGVLMDGYSADITRTYGNADKLTNRQKDVHAAAVGVNKQIIELIRPGLSFAEYFSRVEDIMKLELSNLGLINLDKDYRKYFPHSIGHGLGVDVHDSLAGFDEFAPGMVLTVEPGIYIPEEGMGVRIEDDILVTDHGHTNLSEALSKAL